MATNYRNALAPEPRVFGSPYGMSTPAGTVSSNQAPPPPPRPYQSQSGYGNSSGYGSYGYGGYGGGGYGMGLGGMGGYGMGLGGMGGYGMGMGGMYGGGFNRYGYGGNPADPENRFIQLAEQSSRPAFESIESLVAAVANIAQMLESTLFAITSSFRAILGVAANFGHLRSVFGQFWSTFALFRGLNWMYKKLLYMMGVTKTDPATAIFQEAFEAIDGSAGGQTKSRPRTSPWPVIAFLSFICTAPYLIMKLVNAVTGSAIEEAKDPRRWRNPIQAQAQYDFQATNNEELTIRAGQTVFVAPREIQTSQRLIQSGWALATLDNHTCGIIPINYIKVQQRLQPQTKIDIPPAPENFMNLPEVTQYPGLDLGEQQDVVVGPNLGIGSEDVRHNLEKIDEETEEIYNALASANES